MKVYRIEDERGRGPYQIDMERWTNSNHTDSKHPNPYCESKNFYNKFRLLDKKYPEPGKVIFGFNSINKLKRWFNEEELENLEAIGFNMVTYDADIYVNSHFQTVFVRPD